MYENRQRILDTSKISLLKELQRGGSSSIVKELASHCCYQAANEAGLMLAELQRLGQGKNGSVATGRGVWVVLGFAGGLLRTSRKTPLTSGRGRPMMLGLGRAVFG